MLNGWNHFALARVSGTVFRAARRSNFLNWAAWIPFWGYPRMLDPDSSSAFEYEEDEEEE